MESVPRILVVDDEPVFSLTLTKFLNQNGFEVANSVDWRTAFEKVNEFDPHILLLDIQMPELPGNSLIETIKNLKPGIEVIMVTAVTSEEIKAQCLSSGAFAVLQKPVDFQLLKTTITEALDKSREHPQKD